MALGAPPASVILQFSDAVADLRGRPKLPVAAWDGVNVLGGNVTHQMQKTHCRYRVAPGEVL